MLENFQVIEIKKTVTQKEAPLNVIVEPKRIRFVKAVVEVLGYPAYVRFLFNPETRQFAVQVGKGGTENRCPFPERADDGSNPWCYEGMGPGNEVHYDWRLLQGGQSGHFRSGKGYPLCPETP